MKGSWFPQLTTTEPFPLTWYAIKFRTWDTTKESMYRRTLRPPPRSGNI